MLLAELDKDNEVTSRQYLGNEYVGGELTTKDSNVTDSINISNTKEMCYYICDEQGSIRYVLNQNGEIKNYYQYSAFGESEVAEESYYSRLRYNSQIYDELTSQYYLRASYYQPQIGRFTQEDILYNDGLNLYAYCQNNPVMYSEPSGYAKATNGCDPKVQGENAGDKSGSSSNGIVNGKTPASRLADKLRGLSNSKRPNTVAVIRTADGKYYIGYNKAGIYDKQTQEILDGLGNVNDFNRQCAEVNAVSRALKDEANLEGATISIAHVRGVNNKSGVHGTYKKPCNVCQPLLDYLNIADIQ